LPITTKKTTPKIWQKKQTSKSTSGSVQFQLVMRDFKRAKPEKTYYEYYLRSCQLATLPDCLPIELICYAIFSLYCVSSFSILKN